MDKIVIVDKIDFESGLNNNIQQNEEWNNKFLNSTRNKIFEPTNNKLTDPVKGYFNLINQISDTDNRVTALEKGKENTIENIIVEAENLYKGMSELNETIILPMNIQVINIKPVEHDAKLFKKLKQKNDIFNKKMDNFIHENELNYEWQQ